MAEGTEGGRLIIYLECKARARCSSCASSNAVACIECGAPTYHYSTNGCTSCAESCIDKQPDYEEPEPVFVDDDDDCVEDDE